MASVAKSAGRKVEIIRATAEHRKILHDFFRTVWPSEASADNETDAAASHHPVDSTELSPSVIAVQDGRVIGYLGTLPMRLWDGAREEATHWYKGFMVLPEFRNGPLGFALVKEAAKYLPTALVITVQPASWRLFKAAGLNHVGALENRLRLLRPGRVVRLLDLDRLELGPLPFRADLGLRIVQRLKLSALAGAAIGRAVAAWSAVRGSPSRRVRTSSVRSVDSQAYDALWSCVRTAVRFGQVRDGAYVRQRYEDGTRANYSLIEARAGGELVGFAAIRHPRAEADSRLSGTSVGVISDILFLPARSDVGFALLRAAERAATGLGADALICSASHPALLTVLSKRGYFRIPATLQFLTRLDGGREAGSINDWWLLRADGNSDEGL